MNERPFTTAGQKIRGGIIARYILPENKARGNGSGRNGGPGPLFFEGGQI